VPVTDLTLAVVLYGQIIYIVLLLSGTAGSISPDGAMSPTLASAQLIWGTKTKKLNIAVPALLASGVPEVDAMLPSNMFRYQPVDEFRRGIC